MSPAAIKVNSVSKAFAGRTVLDRVSFVANAGQSVGLIGPNGSGKTTLLRVIAGELAADAGSVESTPGLQLGLLPQDHPVLGDATVAQTFLGLFGEDGGDDFTAIAARLAEEADATSTAALADEYEAALARLESSSTSSVRPRWAELGLREVAGDEPAGRLSGGELAKLALLELVLSQPDALLLDEPTNNLDLAALEWLDDYPDGFAGPVVLVSHDRALLDARAVRIVELDPLSGRAEGFAGNYSAYAEEKARREAELWARYRRQRREEHHLRRVISRAESRGKTLEHRFVRASTTDRRSSSPVAR